MCSSLVLSACQVWALHISKLASKDKVQYFLEFFSQEFCNRVAFFFYEHSMLTEQNVFTEAVKSLMSARVDILTS